MDECRLTIEEFAELAELATKHLTGVLGGRAVWPMGRTTEELFPPEPFWSDLGTGVDAQLNYKRRTRLNR